MITGVLCMTLYQVEGEVDRFRVSSVDDDGRVVDVTGQYEVTAAETEDGRVGFAVFKRDEPWPPFEGECRKDEDPADVLTKDLTELD